MILGLEMPDPGQLIYHTPLKFTTKVLFTVKGKLQEKYEFYGHQYPTSDPRIVESIA